MRRWALLFPGQGMEDPRMGLELARHHEGARMLLEQVSAMLDTNAMRLLRRGGPALHRTAVLQPLLTAVALGACLALHERGLRPVLVAGHSLGEVAAWSAAGGIEPGAAVELAGLRGQVMAREAQRAPGGMLALRGTLADMERAVAVGRAAGHVDLAGHNASRAWTVSGDQRGLRAVAAAFPCKRVQVAGPWHSTLMRGAVEDVRSAAYRLASLAPELPTGDAPTVGLVCNRTGEVAQPSQVPRLLAEQLVNPVQWARTLSTLAAAGVTDIVTAGPGRVLRGLVRDNLGPGVRVHFSDRAADLDLVQELVANEATTC